MSSIVPPVSATAAAAAPGLPASLLPSLGRQELADALWPVVRRLEESLPEAQAREAIDAALATCRALYNLGRSAEALDLARAALSQARAVPTCARTYRALAACGILCADAFDSVSAIEFHAQALKLADQEKLPAEISTAWNNISLALSLAGAPAMAARANARAIEAVDDGSDAYAWDRYVAYINYSHKLFQAGAFEDGLKAARRAIDEMTPEFAARDRHAVILLHRSLVQLLVATGRTVEAGPRVEQLVALGAQADGPRAFVAVATARAAYELAVGREDVAFTRLEQALAKARSVPPCLRDVLVCLIRAEELRGSPERALARLHELSEHVYKLAIEGARRNSAISALGAGPLDAPEQHTRARLVSRLGRPQAPSTWEDLRRMAISAALRADPSGWHGVRVGALTQSLALACGEQPLRALEIGLAAELHDIGLLSIPEEAIARGLPAAEGAYLRHTNAGAEMLGEERHSRLLLAAEISAYHHAWWDGSGHPSNVGGRFIPSAARMCAVSDAYDELVSGFRGTGSVPMGKALKELRSMAGTRLDPQLVEHFEGVVRDASLNRGIDPDSENGMEEFQELVLALQEDRGYL
ncbi:MAG TPA: HD domain-containing phosphohydrolase [Usitatibacter sp.]|nr:HD domain-containing phosphohydrolase [Usitatibacter sp.]